MPCRRAIAFAGALWLAAVAATPARGQGAVQQPSAVGAEPAPAASDANAAAHERAARAWDVAGDAPGYRQEPHVPALEILGFQLLLNRANRYWGTGRDDYRVTAGSIRRNLRSSWGTDNDPVQGQPVRPPLPGRDVPRPGPFGGL